MDFEVKTQDRQSVLDGLRAKRTELVETRTKEIDVEGYDGRLVIRHKYIDFTVFSRDLNKKVKNIKEPGARALTMAVESVLMTTDEILMLVNDELVPLAGEGEGPIGFEARTGEELGFEAKSARQAVYETFGKNEYAIIDHAEKVGKWLKNTSQEADETFLGES